LQDVQNSIFFLVIEMFFVVPCNWLLGKPHCTARKLKEDEFSSSPLGLLCSETHSVVRILFSQISFRNLAFKQKGCFPSMLEEEQNYRPIQMMGLWVDYLHADGHPGSFEHRNTYHRKAYAYGLY
jgi:hypothetical protein